jgi:hypothetical protein
MINEVITGTMESATTTPTATVSEIQTDDWPPEAQVVLEQRVSGGDWKAVANVRGIQAIATPDNSIEYRFRCSNLNTNVRVYFGP